MLQEINFKKHCAKLQLNQNGYRQNLNKIGRKNIAILP